MKYIQGVEEFRLNGPSAVTLGKFDGVHTGHQKLISIVKEKAQENNVLSAAFTFDRIPLSICPQNFQHFITTNTERKRIMESLGLDVEVEYPFTEHLMNTEPEEFIKHIIIGKLNAKYVVVGTDYRFGRNRMGNVDLLIEKGPEYGFETIVVEKEKYQDREISSTYVREELKLGHMETANILLGRPYSVYGIVAKGNQFGRTLEIPTINLYPSESKLLPPNGVYASITELDGRKYYGVTNVGTKPTVSDGFTISVETNLFDFDKDIYGKTVNVSLMHFVRPEMKFESVEALQKQMKGDAKFAMDMFSVK